MRWEKGVTEKYRIEGIKTEAGSLEELRPDLEGFVIASYGHIGEAIKNEQQRGVEEKPKHSGIDTKMILPHIMEIARLVDERKKRQGPELPKNFSLQGTLAGDLFLKCLEVDGLIKGYQDVLNVVRGYALKENIPQKLKEFFIGFVYSGSNRLLNRHGKFLGETHLIYGPYT